MNLNDIYKSDLFKSLLDGESILRQLYPSLDSIKHRERVYKIVTIIITFVIESEHTPSLKEDDFRVRKDFDTSSTNRPYKEGYKIFQIGSGPLRVFLPGGDIDVGIAISPSFLNEFFSDFNYVLENFPRFFASDPQLKSSLSPYLSEDEMSTCITDLKLIDANRGVKVVKCCVLGVPIDITANTLTGLAAVCFFEHIDRVVGRDHLFKRSVLLLKAWLTCDAIVVASNHFLLSSYAVEVMTLFIINHYYSDLSFSYTQACKTQLEAQKKQRKQQREKYSKIHQKSGNDIEIVTEAASVVPTPVPAQSSLSSYGNDLVTWSKIQQSMHRKGVAICKPYRRFAASKLLSLPSALEDELRSDNSVLTPPRTQRTSILHASSLTSDSTSDGPEVSMDLKTQLREILEYPFDIRETGEITPFSVLYRFCEVFSQFDFETFSISIAGAVPNAFLRDTKSLTFKQAADSKLFPPSTKSVKTAVEKEHENSDGSPLLVTCDEKITLSSTSKDDIDPNSDVEMIVVNRDAYHTARVNSHNVNIGWVPIPYPTSAYLPLFSPGVYTTGLERAQMISAVAPDSSNVSQKETVDYPRSFEVPLQTASVIGCDITCAEDVSRASTLLADRHELFGKETLCEKSNISPNNHLSLDSSSHECYDQKAEEEKRADGSGESMASPSTSTTSVSLISLEESSPSTFQNKPLIPLRTLQNLAMFHTTGFHKDQSHVLSMINNPGQGTSEEDDAPTREEYCEGKKAFFPRVPHVLLPSSANGFSEKHMTILDPLDFSNNIGTTVNYANQRRISHSLKEGWKMLNTVVKCAIKASSLTFDVLREEQAKKVDAIPTRFTPTASTNPFTSNRGVLTNEIPFTTPSSLVTNLSLNNDENDTQMLESVTFPVDGSFVVKAHIDSKFYNSHDAPITAREVTCLALAASDLNDLARSNPKAFGVKDMPLLSTSSFVLESTRLQSQQSSQSQPLLHTLSSPQSFSTSISASLSSFSQHNSSMSMVSSSTQRSLPSLDTIGSSANPQSNLILNVMHYSQRARASFYAFFEKTLLRFGDSEHITSALGVVRAHRSRKRVLTRAIARVDSQLLSGNASVIGSALHSSVHSVFSSNNNSVNSANLSLADKYINNRSNSGDYGDSLKHETRSAWLQRPASSVLSSVSQRLLPRRSDLNGVQDIAQPHSDGLNDEHSSLGNSLLSGESVNLDTCMIDSNSKGFIVNSGIFSSRTQSRSDKITEQSGEKIHSDTGTIPDPTSMSRLANKSNSSSSQNIHNSLCLKSMNATTTSEYDLEVKNSEECFEEFDDGIIEMSRKTGASTVVSSSAYPFGSSSNSPINPVHLTQSEVDEEDGQMSMSDSVHLAVAHSSSSMSSPLSGAISGKNPKLFSQSTGHTPSHQRSLSNANSDRRFDRLDWSEQNEGSKSLVVSPSVSSASNLRLASTLAISMTASETLGKSVDSLKSTQSTRSTGNDGEVSGPGCLTPPQGQTSYLFSSESIPDIRVPKSSDTYSIASSLPSSMSSLYDINARSSYIYLGPGGTPLNTAERYYDGILQDKRAFYSAVEGVCVNIDSVITCGMADTALFIANRCSGPSTLRQISTHGLSNMPKYSVSDGNSVSDQESSGFGVGTVSGVHTNAFAATSSNGSFSSTTMEQAGLFGLTSMPTLQSRGYDSSFATSTQSQATTCGLDLGTGLDMRSESIDGQYPSQTATQLSQHHQNHNHHSHSSVARKEQTNFSQKSQENEFSNVDRHLAELVDNGLFWRRGMTLDINKKPTSSFCWHSSFHGSVPINAMLSELSDIRTFLTASYAKCPVTKTTQYARKPNNNFTTTTSHSQPQGIYQAQSAQTAQQLSQPMMSHATVSSSSNLSSSHQAVNPHHDIITVSQSHNNSNIIVNAGVNMNSRKQQTSGLPSNHVHMVPIVHGVNAGNGGSKKSSGKNSGKGVRVVGKR